jgi:hypothetical protein
MQTLLPKPIIKERLPGYELRLSFYLEAFVDIYRDATEMLENPNKALSATEWVRAERRRQTAVYEIAPLLEIPDLPAPGAQLSPHQWQQCMDFLSDREAA